MSQPYTFYYICIYMENFNQTFNDPIIWPLTPKYEKGFFPGEIMKEEAYAGDIVIANENGDKKFILQSNYEANA